MKRILIIEDEPDIQELLDAYLRDAGYETATAGDGVEALARFQEASYDLILLDLMLPKIDGFGVCEWIRRESAVPILMLTALDAADRQRTGGGRKPALSGADSGGGRDGGLPGRPAAGSDRAGI